MGVALEGRISATSRSIIAASVTSSPKISPRALNVLHRARLGVSSPALVAVGGGQFSTGDTRVSIQAAPQSDAESSREWLLIDASIDAQMSRPLLGSPPIGGKARCAGAPIVICPEFETDLLPAQMIARASPGTDRHAENE